MVWTQACALSPSSSPKPCSRNHRPRAATRKMVGRYTQQASSRITAWRVGHIIYRVSHVKLPTCWFITKPKQHRQGSILSSCLGWQVALSLKKPQTNTEKKLPFFLLPPKNKESNNKKHPPPKHRNPCHNPGKKNYILVEIPSREIIIQNMGSIGKLNLFLEAYRWIKGRNKWNKQISNQNLKQVDKISLEVLIQKLMSVSY